MHKRACTCTCRCGAAACVHAVQHAVQVRAVDDFEAELDEAKARLLWVADNSADGKIKPIALSRLAQVHLAQGDVDAAAAAIAAIDPAFAGEFLEVRGDVALAQGETATARALYSAALNDVQKRGSDGESLQMKIDNLALAQR